ncbi:reverse transcriptase [Gossypium australe]|uniref:Reverse transcriptase n=1 Tax=Gossypium australe TaxID=47621 RepID=A0A5B6X3N9_9ROSI|nr:reverse transcriptase [Gossypium australe]
MRHCSNFVSKKSVAVRNESAPDGGAALPSTFKVSSKGKAVVVDISLTLKLTHVCLARYSNRFKALSVELKDSNDSVDDDIDAEQIKGFNDVVVDDNKTKQLKFSPWKPRLASLAVGPFVRSLMATKQENLDKGKKKMNSSPAKGLGKVGGKGVDRLVRLKIDVCCLLENRVKCNNASIILGKYFQGWNFVCNYDHAVNGQIWLIWKNACIVDVLYVFDQCITCSVQVQHQKIFFLAVYACNDGVSHREL